MTNSAMDMAISSRWGTATDENPQTDAGTSEQYVGENLYISSTSSVNWNADEGVGENLYVSGADPQTWTGSWPTEFATADPVSGQVSPANDNGDAFYFSAPDDHIPDGETLYIAPQFEIPDGETLYVAADQTGHPGATDMNSLFWDAALETPAQDARVDTQTDWTDADPIVNHEAIHVLQNNESNLF